MIDNIMTLLELARETNMRGEYIDFALGKEKLPISFSDLKNNLKLKK